MEIDATTDLADFRAQLREWIGRNAPAGLADLTDWTGLLRGGDAWWSYEAEMATDAYRVWDRRLTEEGLVCGHWPAKYGGRDLTPEHTRILDEECLRANVPRVFREQGEAWIGPTILAHGTEEQRQYYLPRIIDGSHRYAQGFSEPDHGSDLAAIETKGVVEGDALLITGEKVWTTGADYATHLAVLCRTDPSAAPRHRGITFVIVDVRDNLDTIEIRPIRQLTGESRFAETFFDRARAPLGAVIGGIDQGWKAAMTTLDNERVGRTRAAARNASYDREFQELLTVVRERGVLTEPGIRQKILDVYTTLQALHFWATPGAPTVHPSIEKVVYTEWEQRFGELALEALGEQAGLRPDGEGYALDRLQHFYLRSLSSTIASGSSEIQRNIIAERLLGLPREASGPVSAPAHARRRSGQLQAATP